MRPRRQQQGVFLNQRRGRRRDCRSSVLLQQSVLLKERGSRRRSSRPLLKERGSRRRRSRPLLKERGQRGSGVLLQQGILLKESGSGILLQERSDSIAVVGRVGGKGQEGRGEGGGWQGIPTEDGGTAAMAALPVPRIGVPTSANPQRVDDCACHVPSGW